MWEESLIGVLLFFGTYLVIKTYSKKHSVVVATVLLLIFTIGLFTIRWLKEKKQMEPFIAGNTCGPDLSGNTGQCLQDKPYCLITERKIENDTIDQTVVFSTYGRYVSIFPDAAGTVLVNLSQVVINGTTNNNIGLNKTVTAPCDNGATNYATQAASTVNGSLTQRSWPDIWRATTTNKDTAVWQVDLGSVQMITTVRYIGQLNSTPGSNKGIRIRVYRDVTNPKEKPTQGTCIPMPTPIYPAGTTEVEQRAIRAPILYGVDPMIALNVFRGVKNSSITPLTMYGLTDQQAAAAYIKLQVANNNSDRQNGTITDDEYFTSAKEMKGKTSVNSLPFIASAALSKYKSANKSDYVVPRNMNIMSRDSNGNYVVDTSQGTGITTIPDNGEYMATTEILSVMMPRSVDPANTATKGIAAGSGVASSTITKDMNKEPTQVSNNWAKGAFGNMTIQPTGIQLPTNEVLNINDTWSDAEIQNALKGRGSANAKKSDYSDRMNSGATDFLKGMNYSAPSRDTNTLSRTIPGAGTTNGPLKEVFWIGPTATTGYSTMTDANQACIDAGADGLATPAQLTEAQDARAQWCVFGWLSDGSSKFPMQENKTGCGMIGVNPSTCPNCPSTTVVGANCFGVKPLQTSQIGFTALPFTSVNGTSVWNQKSAYNQQSCGPGLVLQNCKYDGQMRSVCMNPGQTCDSSCPGPENIVNGQKVCNAGDGAPGPQEPIMAPPQIQEPNSLSGIANLVQMAPTRSNKITSTDTDLAEAGKSVFMGRILRAAAYTTSTDTTQDVYLGESGRWIMIFRNTNGAHLNISNVQVRDGQGGSYTLDMEGGRPDINQSGQNITTYNGPATTDALAPVVFTALQNTSKLNITGSSTGTVNSALNYSVTLNASKFTNPPAWNNNELLWTVTDPNGRKLQTNYQAATYSFTPEMPGEYSIKVFNNGHWNTENFNAAAVYQQWTSIASGGNEPFAVTGGFTHNEAQDKCSSYGASLATNKQLDDARKNAAADWCSAGWTTDGAVPWNPALLVPMYPVNLQKNVTGCGNGNPGLIFVNPASPGAICYGIKPREGLYSDVLHFIGGNSQGPALGAVWNNPSPDTIMSFGQYMIGGPSRATPGTTVSYSFASYDSVSGNQIKWTITDPNNTKTSQEGSNCSFTPTINGDYKISANPNKKTKYNPINTVTSINFQGTPTLMTLTGPSEATINTSVTVTTNGMAAWGPYTLSSGMKWTIIDPNGNEVTERLISLKFTTFTPTVLGIYRINLNITNSRQVVLENANIIINITASATATATNYKGVTATVGRLMRITAPVEGTINTNLQMSCIVQDDNGAVNDANAAVGWTITDPNGSVIVNQNRSGANFSFSPTMLGMYIIRADIFTYYNIYTRGLYFDDKRITDGLQIATFLKQFFYINVTDADGSVVVATLNVGPNDTYTPPYEFKVVVDPVKAYYQVPPYRDMGAINVPSGMNLTIDGPGHSYDMGQPKTYVASGASVTNFRWRVARPGSTTYESQNSNSNTMTFTPYTAGMYQIQVFAYSNGSCQSGGLDSPSCPNFNLYLRVEDPAVAYKASKNLTPGDSQYWLSNPKNVTHNYKLTLAGKNNFGGWFQNWKYGYINPQDINTVIEDGGYNASRTDPTSRAVKDCRPDVQRTDNQAQGFQSLENGVWIARINNNSTVSPYVDGVTITFSEPAWGDYMYTCNKKYNQGVVVVLADSIDVSPSDYYLMGASVLAMRTLTDPMSPFWTETQFDKPPQDANSANCINMAADPSSDPDMVARTCGLPPYSDIPAVKQKYKNFCDMTGGQYMVSNGKLIQDPVWLAKQKSYAENIALGAQVKMALDKMNDATKKVTDANGKVTGDIQQYNAFVSNLYTQCALPTDYNIDFFPYEETMTSTNLNAQGQYQQKVTYITTRKSVLTGDTTTTRSDVQPVGYSSNTRLTTKDGIPWDSWQHRWPDFFGFDRNPTPKPSYWDGMKSFYDCIKGDSTVQMITSKFGDATLGAIRNTIKADREAVKPFLEPQQTAYEAYTALVDQQIARGSANGGIDKATGDANKAAALAGLAKELPPKLATPDLTPIANVMKTEGKITWMFSTTRDINLNDPL